MALAHGAQWVCRVALPNVPEHFATASCSATRPIGRCSPPPTAASPADVAVVALLPSSNRVRQQLVELDEGRKHLGEVGDGLLRWGDGAGRIVRRCEGQRPEAAEHQRRRHGRPPPTPRMRCSHRGSMFFVARKRNRDPWPRGGLALPAHVELQAPGRASRAEAVGPCPGRAAAGIQGGCERGRRSAATRSGPGTASAPPASRRRRADWSGRWRHPADR